MKLKGILVFCSVLAVAVALFFAYETFVAGPKTLITALQSALVGIFQNKITINVQNDTLGVKPIAELALADIRVRSIVNYNTVVFGSEKHMIAHESFDIKIGWDMKDDINFVTHPALRSVRILAKPPHILS